MAAQNVFQMMESDAALQGVMNDLQERLSAYRAGITVNPELTESLVNEAEVASLIVTGLNGYSDLPEQRVKVEYLSQTQKMMIPLAMAVPSFNAIPNSLASPTATLLRARCWKVNSMRLADLRRYVTEKVAVVDIRTAVDAIADTVEHTAAPSWAGEFQSNAATPRTQMDAIFAYVSQALQFNCDLRDLGILNYANMRMRDDFWSHAEDPPQTTTGGTTICRLAVKIKPLTLRMIAAMNLAACRRCELAAWTRAFGLGAGILPVHESQVVKEYVWVAGFPSDADRTAVMTYERSFPDHIYSVCLNIIAMFGLFHLSKDHTFKTNDDNMDRIARSYINAIRTLVSDNVLDYMIQHTESIVRTAVHPFGLGQSYYVALYLGHVNKLASPLAKRLNVTPPGVQRLMIVQAAMDEWKALPLGRMCSDIFANIIKTVEDEIVKVLASPPAYSGLYKLYGINEMSKVTVKAEASADSMMPMVYGFAMSHHVSENKQREGLALALSLINIHSRHASLANAYLRMWETYMDDFSKEGLEKFIRQSLATTLAANPVLN